MKIWYKGEDGQVELLDECEKSEVSSMLREYRMAMPKAVIWAGLKRDAPRTIHVRPDAAMVAAWRYLQ